MNSRNLNAIHFRYVRYYHRHNIRFLIMTNIPLKRSFTIFRIQIYSTRSVSVQSLNTDRVDLNSLIFFKWLLVVPFLIYRIRIIGYNLFDIKYRLGFESQKRDKTIIRILFKNLFRLAVRMCVSTCSHRYLTSDFGVFKLF